MPINTVIDPRPEFFGWETYVQEKRGSTKITINRLIAKGFGLVKGAKLHCYIGRDKDDRQIMYVYLDGEPRKTKFNKMKFEDTRKINRIKI